MEPGCYSICCADQPAAHMLPALANAVRAATFRPMGGRKRHSADCASGVCLSPSGAMESRPANAVHSRKSVIFYPVIPVCIVASVRSKSLRKPATGHPSPLPQWGCRRACAGQCFSVGRTRFPPPSKKAVPGRGRLFLCDGDHQILVMSTRSTSLMVVSMSRHSVRAMAVSTAVRQAMDRSTALRRICTECSAGLRPVALVEIR